GPDSTHESTGDDVVGAAKSLSRSTGSVVAVSGAVDIITDGARVVGSCVRDNALFRSGEPWVGSTNGVPMLQKITATGCSVTDLIAAFVAVDPSHPLEATATALSVFGLAGEAGMGRAHGPGSLRAELIDALHGLDRDTVHRMVKIGNVS
ncbi:hypothetical protein MIMGU_mgv1a021684mg, partial [Erythranthe guttata]